MTTSREDSPTESFSRRRFLRISAGICGALSVVPAHVVSGQDQSSRKITLAGVGIGGVGNSQLQECAKTGFQIVALCDVDASYAKKSFDLWPQARRYTDFRELLRAEGDRIDAVYCGTPDHTHALITLAALRRKKHVCCVKPLTRTVRELRMVVDEALRAGVATQVTAAPNTTEPGCRTTEVVAAGVLGAVRELHVWSNRPVWPQGMTRPQGEDPVPAGFDWKLWLGPAPLRPFKNVWQRGDYALNQMNLRDWDPGVAGVYHPFNFRGWWDFGTGALGDMGCHHFNTPFRALKLGAPIHVEASATKVFSESAPLASIVTLEFPARGVFPPLRATWYDGGLKPAQPSAFRGQAWPSEGTLYIGEEGCLLSGWDGIKVVPEAVAKRAKQIARSLPRRGGTWEEWLIACQGGERAGCNFAWAGPLTETVLLGNAAIRCAKPLDWDSKRLHFTNADDANKLLGEPYQNGWSLDDV